MENKLENAFKNLRDESTPESNNELCEKIWHAVVAYNKRMAQIKLWIFSLIAGASAIVLVPATIALVNRFSQSGFYEYTSLVFSDLGSVVSLWREFGLLLAESLPVTDIVISLSLVFIFFLSVRYLMKQIIIKNQLSY